MENFLLEIVNKSNVRLEPDESPLVTALGISFDQEFSDANIAHLKQYLHPKIPENQAHRSLEESLEESLDVISSIENSSIKEMDDSNSDIETTEEISQPVDFDQQLDEEDKAFNPKEFIDDEKFLEQFIADSTNPTDTSMLNSQIEEDGRDYLRSALEELTQSDEEESTEDVAIQFNNEKAETNTSQDVIFESDESIDEALETKETSRLLSSSLRDALRMLREEE